MEYNIVTLLDDLDVFQYNHCFGGIEELKWIKKEFLSFNTTIVSVESRLTVLYVMCGMSFNTTIVSVEWA